MGWEPATRSWKVSGTRYSVREPEWDWVDRAIIAAWERLQWRLCTMCGRPWSVHDTDDEDDYQVGYLTCTATLRLDREQAAHRRARPPRSDGSDPERANQWTTWTAAEGPPTFPEHDS